MNRSPARNRDLHGNVPETSPVALLLIDVINDLDFEGSGPLVRQAAAMAPRHCGAEAAGQEAGIPTVYINDNFGRWQSDFREVVDALPRRRRARRRRSPGMLAPGRDDYFVLKPKHSAFFETTLDTLLTYLGTQHTDPGRHRRQHLHPVQRQRRVHARLQPRSCRRIACVSNTPAENAYALEQIARVLKADVTPSADLDLGALVRGANRPRMHRRARRRPRRTRRRSVRR